MHEFGYFEGKCNTPLYTSVSGTFEELKMKGCSLGVFFEGEKESSGLSDFLGEATDQLSWTQYF